MGGRPEPFPFAVDPEPSFLLPLGALRRMRRPLWELGDWLRVVRTMRQLDMLVVTGTGIITDENQGATGCLSWSLRLAKYRSYRDLLTRQRAESQTLAASQLTVAVGIYAVEGGDAARRAYLDALGNLFALAPRAWYRARIVIGDVKYE